MPSKVGKPNLGANLKTSFNMSIPRAGAQTPGRVGEVATSNKIFTGKGGGRASGGSKPKRTKAKSMY